MGHRTDNIKDVIIDTYNSHGSRHRTLKNKKSNQIFKYNDDQIASYLNDIMHNHQAHQLVPFDTGDKVRILEKNESLIKESKKSLVKKYIHYTSF
jgi:hypothetical protein